MGKCLTNTNKLCFYHDIIVEFSGDIEGEAACPRPKPDPARLHKPRTGSESREHSSY